MNFQLFLAAIAYMGVGLMFAMAFWLLGGIGYAIEISPAYCDMGLARIAHLTGAEPVLAETGHLLSAATAERRSR